MSSIGAPPPGGPGGPEGPQGDPPPPVPLRGSDSDEPRLRIAPRQRVEPARPAPKSSPLGWIVLGLFVGVTAGGACSACLGAAGGVGPEEIVAGSRDKVGVVELVGEISDTSEVVRNLREFTRRDDLDAIVVRIDSPGGAVAPSQEVYAAMRAASKKKPVVASMGSVAASGGFWAALGADWIFAQPGSVTGSIGVVSQVADLRGVAELLRVRFRTFKSGPLKDSGNPFREMTPEDEAHFMSLIDDIYAQFTELVAERRDLDMERVRALADGRVMTGRAAKAAGLVDELGGLYDAARKAVVLAKLRASEAEEGDETVTSTVVPDELKDPTLVYPKKPMPGLLRYLAEGATGAVRDGIRGGVEAAAREADVLGGAGSPVELR